MLIGDRLLQRVQSDGAREAVATVTERASWQELGRLAERVAGGLLGLGVAPGDFVAVQLPNSLAYLAAWYGALLMGATVVPLNPRYQPNEIGYILADAQAVATIAFAPLAPALEGVRPKLPKLRHVLLADLSALSGVVDGPVVAPAPTMPFEAWVRGAGPTLTPWRKEAAVPDSSPATCLYTAGTTGRPKGALLTHAGLLWDIDSLLKVFSVTEADRILCVLPMFHSYAQMACVIASLATGCTLVTMPQFRPDAVLETITRERITIFPGVPAFYGALLSAARPGSARSLGSLRLAVTGGAAMPLPVLQALEDVYGVLVLEGNGPTEAGPVAYCNPERGVRKPGSVGLPVPGMRVRVVDADDQDLPRGEVGEVLVQGPSVMRGYLNRPEETERTLLGGWLHTGDLGRLDEDGYLFLVDRKTDLIIVGGLNVYPREVEEALLAHAAVAEAAVVGVPEEARGEQVVAIVVLREGASATPRELIRHCRLLLAPYKCPRHVLFQDQLSKNAAGKVEKLPLRVLAQQEVATRSDTDGETPA